MADEHGIKVDVRLRKRSGNQAKDKARAQAAETTKTRFSAAGTGLTISGGHDRQARAPAHPQDRTMRKFRAKTIVAESEPSGTETLRRAHTSPAPEHSARRIILDRTQTSTRDGRTGDRQRPTHGSTARRGGRGGRCYRSRESRSSTPDPRAGSHSPWRATVAKCKLNVGGQPRTPRRGRPRRSAIAANTPPHHLTQSRPALRPRRGRRTRRARSCQTARLDFAHKRPSTPDELARGRAENPESNREGPLVYAGRRNALSRPQSSAACGGLRREVPAPSGSLPRRAVRALLGLHINPAGATSQ